MSLAIVGYNLMVYGRGGFWDTSIAYFKEYEAALKTKRYMEARNCQPTYIQPVYRASYLIDEDPSTLTQ